MSMLEAEENTTHLKPKGPTRHRDVRKRQAQGRGPGQKRAYRKDGRPYGGRLRVLAFRV